MATFVWHSKSIGNLSAILSCMQTEIEAKWLQIDIQAMRDRLRSAGATVVAPERLMKRTVYDFPDNRLQSMGGWARVRDEGNKVTMSYKQLNSRTLHGTEEVTVTVDDYMAACSLLASIGMVQKSYQETKRESWVLQDTEVELDTWPWIPSFIEIEAKTEEKLLSVANTLLLDMQRARFGSVEVAYQAEYAVTEDEINAWPEIVFSAVPSWLGLKRIKTNR